MNIGFPEVTPEFEAFIRMMDKRRCSWRVTFFVGCFMVVATTTSAAMLWIVAYGAHRYLPWLLAGVQTGWLPFLCWIVEKARKQWRAATLVYKHGSAAMKSKTVPQVICEADQLNAAIENYNKL